MVLPSALLAAAVIIFITGNSYSADIFFGGTVPAILVLCAAGFFIFSAVISGIERCTLIHTLKQMAHPDIPNRSSAFIGLPTIAIKLLRKAANKSAADKIFIKTLLDSIPNAVLLCDARGRIILTNKALSVFFCSEDDFSGTSVENIFQEPFHGRKIMEMISNDKPHISLYWQAGFNDDSFPVFVNVSKIFFENEPFLLFIITDLSETKKAYDDLEFSTALIDNAFDPIIARKDDGTIVYANTAACRMYQMTLDELLSANAEDIIFPTSLKEYRDIILRLRNTQSCEAEIWRKKKNGTFIPSLTSCSSVHSKGIDLVIETHHDLSEIKKNQNALRESEERFRTFFDNAKDCVMIITINGSILNINTAGLILFEINQKNVQETDFFTLIADDLRRKEFMSSIQSCGSVRDFTTELHKTNGALIPVEINASYFHNPLYHLSGYNLFIKDLSIVKAMEARIRQAHKLDAIGRLAGGIAHDFNNLLTIILGNTDIAIHDKEISNKIRENLSQIRESAERASKLTEQLLTFGRQQKTNVEKISPNEIIHNLSRMLKRLMSGVIELNLDLDPSSGSILADKNQFEQIIVNLVLNARDSILEKKDGEKKIVIKTSHVFIDSGSSSRHPGSVTGSNVLIRVIDTGVGIPNENIYKIFDPFFTTKSSDKGTGLGLSTVFGIVSQYNAQIFVSSAETTVFDIYWPKVEGNTFPAKEKEPEREVSGNGETILIIEDEMSLCLFTASALRSKGFNAIGAHSAEQAYEITKGNPALDLAFIDIAIPGGNGYDCAQKLREIIPNLKILFTSGFPENTPEHMNNADGLLFISKPYNIRKLAAMIGEILKSGENKDLLINHSGTNPHAGT
jgi:PAS domain S-box-containing protein